MSHADYCSNPLKSLPVCTLPSPTACSPCKTQSDFVNIQIIQVTSFFCLIPQELLISFSVEVKIPCQPKRLSMVGSLSSLGLTSFSFPPHSALASLASFLFPEHTQYAPAESFLFNSLLITETFHDTLHKLVLTPYLSTPCLTILLYFSP